MNQSWQMQIFQLANKNRSRVIFCFKIFHFMFAAIILFGAYNILTNTPLTVWFYNFGINLGRTALVLLMLAMLPGILGRFGIRIQITFLLTNFRRHIGILTFLCAFAHYCFIFLMPAIASGTPPQLPLPLFMTLGSLALFLLFFLFLTSNNVSVIKLGRWWKRLHRIIYVIVWLIFFHVALQRISIWTILIGSIALLETTSLLYGYFKKKRSHPL